MLTDPPRYRHHFVRLRDGRALCYMDVGPPDAPPVIHLHGMATSCQVVYELTAPSDDRGISSP